MFFIVTQPEYLILISIVEHFCVSNRHVQGVYLTLSKLGRRHRVAVFNLTGVCRFSNVIQ